jgi:hypothetical protein
MVQGYVLIGDDRLRVRRMMIGISKVDDSAALVTSVKFKFEPRKFVNPVWHGGAPSSFKLQVACDNSDQDYEL